MSILGRFIPRELETRNLTSSAFVPPPAMGVIDDYVGVHRAMSHLTVMACVRLLADTIASLPWKVYKRDGKGIPKEVKPQPKIVSQPYPGFDLFQWKWMVIASMALRGNSYHFVTSRDTYGYPTALLPLHPDVVFLERRADLLEWFNPVYRIMGEAVANVDMVHMRRFTLPGEPWGLSPIRQAAVAIGMGLSAEEYGYRFFKESANPSGMLTTEQELDEGAIQRQQQNWIQSHGGRRLPAVLTGGFKWQNLTITPEESQFLQCVTEGTPVTMADGTRRAAGKLCVGDRLLAWDGSKLVGAAVRAVGKPPLKPLVKIVTRRGRQLTCTVDHPVLGVRKLRTHTGIQLDATGEWLPAGSLEAGNYVRVALGNAGESGALSFDIAYFLGQMAGDGNLRRGTCYWYSSDEAAIDRMARIIESLGGSLALDRERQNVSEFRVRVGYADTPIKGILSASGLIGRTAPDKFVPDSIMAGGPDAWRGFLSGYMDSDGSVRDVNSQQRPRMAFFSSVSPGLLDGCQHLLTLLGINSTIRRSHGARQAVINGYRANCRETWVLQITGAGELGKLAAQLDLAHTEKRRRLAEYVELGGRRNRPANFDLDRVESVEYLGDGETIGIEVEGVHTHVTGGLISHNTRQFQRSEICMMYGVPPILIGDTKETTAWGTGVEQITLGAVTYTFRAWTGCIESVISSCLPRGQFVRFDYDALLRGDMDGRYGAYAKAVGSNAGAGWITRNEIRAKEEMDPVTGGDQLLQPAMMVPAGFPPVGTQPQPAPDSPGTLPMPPIGGGEDGANTPARNGKPLAAGRW